MFQLFGQIKDCNLNDELKLKGFFSIKISADDLSKAVLQSANVNTFDFKLTERAKRLARQLLAQAKQNEPTITKDLLNIAFSTKANIIGLEDKFKSETSLVRKLIDKSKAGNTMVENIARRNNDVLRYTFIFPNREYAIGVGDSIKMLRQNGYKISSNHIWNAWQNEGSAKDIGYRGINITVISSQNQKFELQFHTTESFRLKTETHYLYEELRDLKTSDQRKLEIIKEMLRLAKEIKRPEGI